MKDEWRPINKFPEYEINRRGDVRRVSDGKTLKPVADKPIYGGYVRVGLYTSNKQTYALLLHRAVAEAFVPNPDGKRYVHHLDGDRTNNSTENLIWVTSKEHREYHRKNKKIS